MDNPKSLFNTNTKVCETVKVLCHMTIKRISAHDVGKTKSKMYHWKERSNYSSLLLTFDLYFFSTSVRNLSSSSAFISTFSSGDLMTIS